MSGGEPQVRVVVVVERKTDLLEIVLALHSGRGFADLLDRRQEKTDQDGDDRNHHQQLNERERPGRVRPPSVVFPHKYTSRTETLTGQKGMRAAGEKGRAKKR